MEHRVDAVDEQASAIGAVLSEKPPKPLEVLVVSSREDGVAELVAAVLQKVGNNVRVRAAGGFPSGGVQTTVGRVGELLGLDVISNFPQRLTPELHHAADVIVTLDESAVTLTKPELDGPQRVSHWHLKPLVDHHVDSYLGMVQLIEERLRADHVLTECRWGTEPST